MKASKTFEIIAFILTVAFCFTFIGVLIVLHLMGLCEILLKYS